MRIRPPARRVARALLPRGVALCICLLLAAACTQPSATVRPSTSGSQAPSGTIRLYTSVTQDTVDATLAAFAAVYPDVTVELFRAPTGEVDARIAAERREGRVLADVLWGTDPLSTAQYDADGLLLAFDPPNAEDLPDAYRGETSWGTRILNVVMVVHDGVEPMPADWPDLTDDAYRDGVAFADPGFAGSALGTIAHFALTDAYGLDFLRALHDNGAVQLQSIGDVVTGVAEEQFEVGLALDKSIRDAVDAGSPVQLVWPASGSIAIYSPISVFAASGNPDAAQAFVDFVLGPDAQAAISGTGWQPVRADVPWPYAQGEQQQPDWDEAFERRDELLDEYRSIFGG
jgi:iron(III) transport system substrate-binding protein